MLNVVPEVGVGDGMAVPVAWAGPVSSAIDEIVREGAQQMLAAALRAEVAAYCAQFADERDENDGVSAYTSPDNEP
jgi:hypothetical protein